MEEPDVGFWVSPALTTGRCLLTGLYCATCLATLAVTLRTSAVLSWTALPFSLPLPVIHPLGVILASQLILLGYRDHIFQSWQEGCPSAGLGLRCSQGHTLPDLCDS